MGGEPEAGDEPDQDPWVGGTPKPRTPAGDQTEVRFLEARGDFAEDAWPVALENTS